MDIDEIVDQASLEAWLKGQPREVPLMIAHRAAMRILPIFWAQALKSQAEEPLLAVLRWNLISEVALYTEHEHILAALEPANRSHTAGVAAAVFSGVYDAEDVTGAVNSAYEAVRSVGAAINATISDDVTFGFLDLFQGLVRKDIMIFRAPSGLFGTSLWQSHFNPFSGVWSLVVRDAEESWAFWRDWYQGALDGVVPDWAMLEEIALIAPEVWDQGPEVVNGVIAGIVEKYKDGGNALRGRSAREVLAENTRVVRLQLETMVALIEDEILRVHGANDISDHEAERIGARVAVLRELIEKLQEMLVALEDSAGRALVVIEEQLPQIVEAAEELDEAPQVSGALIAMAASVKCLTDAGVPGMLATGMAGADIARVAVINKFKRAKSKGG